MRKLFVTIMAAMMALFAIGTTACSADEARPCVTVTQVPGAPKPVVGPDGKVISKADLYEVNLKLAKGVTQPTLIASDQNKILGWPQTSEREIGVNLPAGHYRVSCYGSNGNGRTNTFVVARN